MKTVGLVVLWAFMTFAFVFEFADIENIREFIIVYAMLCLYLGCMAWCYIKKKNGQKDSKTVTEE